MVFAIGSYQILSVDQIFAGERLVEPDHRLSTELLPDPEPPRTTNISPAADLEIEIPPDDRLSKPTIDRRP